jgi:Flp pilus assembly protein TadD
MNAQLVPVAGGFPWMVMRHRSSLRVVATASLVALIAAGMGGCSTLRPSDVTGSIARSDAPQSEAEWRKSSQIYGERYRADPKDADAALRYGQALRALGQRQQAVAVLEQATVANAGNTALLATYGRALADNGNYQLAFDTLSRAHTPDNPDWSILSVQGTVLDRMGRHDDARSYYASALKIKPEEPSVLSNLGMSYVLSKDLTKAEDALRRAYAGAAGDLRIRQNLALVVGLQGRVAEAEEIARAGLPPDQAEANVASLKEMLSRSDGRRNPKSASVAAASRS